MPTFSRFTLLFIISIFNLLSFVFCRWQKKPKNLTWVVFIYHLVRTPLHTPHLLKLVNILIFGFFNQFEATVYIFLWPYLHYFYTLSRIVALTLEKKVNRNSAKRIWLNYMYKHILFSPHSGSILYTCYRNMIYFGKIIAPGLLQVVKLLLMCILKMFSLFLSNHLEVHINAAYSSTLKWLLASSSGLCCFWVS